MNDAIQILEEILGESRLYDGALIYISEYHWKALEMAIDALKRSKEEVFAKDTNVHARTIQRRRWRGMKYIIDVPDKYVMGTNPRRLMICKDTISIATGIELTPYNEPSQKAIDLQHAHDIENVARMNYSKGAEDAWEFVKKIEHEIPVCDLMDIYGDESETYQNFTYQDAKAKYEAWKKSKDEIRVGDEVVYNSELYNYEAKGVVLSPQTDDTYAVILTLHNLNRIVASNAELEKTGRHFPEVDELLKKMKEKQNDT